MSYFIVGSESAISVFPSKSDGIRNGGDKLKGFAHIQTSTQKASAFQSSYMHRVSHITVKARQYRMCMTCLNTDQPQVTGRVARMGPQARLPSPRARAQSPSAREHT